MRHFAKILQNSNGLTLVEVLAAFTISTLVLGIIYGLLMAGYRTYEKVGIEQSLRDEADYVISKIMGTLDEGDISDIKNKCQNTTSAFPETNKNLCIEIHKTVATKIATSDDESADKYKIGIPSFNELKDDLIITQIKIIKETIDDEKVKNTIVIEDYEAELNNSTNEITITKQIHSEKLLADRYDFFIAPKDSTEDGSEIKATCSYEASIITDQSSGNKLINKKCTNGVVDISLILKRANIDDNYRLQLKSQFGF